MAHTQIMDFEWEEGEEELEDQGETLKGYLIPIDPNTGDPKEGGEIQLYDETITIGRRPKNTVVLENQTISGLHAKIHFSGGYTTIEDLKSTNKSALAHAPVFDKPFPPNVQMQLASRMYVKFGDLIFRFLNREDYVLLMEDVNLERDDDESAPAGDLDGEAPSANYSFMEQSQPEEDKQKDEGAEENLDNTVVIEENSADAVAPPPTQVFDSGEADNTEDLFADLAPTQNVLEDEPDAQQEGPAATQLYEDEDENTGDNEEMQAPAPTQAFDDENLEEQLEDQGNGGALAPTMELGALEETDDEAPENANPLVDDQQAGGEQHQVPPTQVFGEDLDDQEDEDLAGCLAPTMQIEDDEEGSDAAPEPAELAPTMAIPDEMDEENEAENVLAPTMAIPDADEDEDLLPDDQDEDLLPEESGIAPTMQIGSDEDAEEPAADENPGLAPTMAIQSDDEQANEELQDAGIAPTMAIGDDDDEEAPAAEDPAFAPTMAIGSDLEETDEEPPAEAEPAFAPTMAIGDDDDEESPAAADPAFAPTMAIGSDLEATDEEPPEAEPGLAPTMAIPDEDEGQAEENADGPEFAPTMAIGEDEEEEPPQTVEDFPPTMAIGDDEDESEDLLAEEPEEQEQAQAPAQAQAENQEAEEDAAMDAFMASIDIGEDDLDANAVQEPTEPPKVDEPQEAEQQQDQEPAEAAEEEFLPTMVIGGDTDDEENVAQNEEAEPPVEDNFPATIVIGDDEDDTDPPAENSPEEAAPAVDDFPATMVIEDEDVALQAALEDAPAADDFPDIMVYYMTDDTQLPLLLEPEDVPERYGACEPQVNIQVKDVEYIKKVEALEQKFLSDMQITEEFFAGARGLLQNHKEDLLEEMQYSTAVFQSDMSFHEQVLEKTKCHCLYYLNKKRIEEDFLGVRRPLREALCTAERDIEELQHDFDRDVRGLTFLFKQKQKQLANESETAKAHTLNLLNSPITSFPSFFF